MTCSPIISRLLALLIVFGASPALAQSSGDGLAEELNSVRQQRRQLELDIDQYETSIKQLGSGESDQENASPAVTALGAQLQRSRKRLLQLVEQEAEILDKLPGGAAPRRPPSVSGSDEQEMAEVAQLKLLLKNYSSQAAVEEPETSVPETTASTTSLADPAANGSYTAERVKLTGIEGVSAIRDIGQRLGDDFSSAQRRQLDIIFHIEVRNKGALLSSRSHNFKALGKSQYISKVSLAGGTAVISVRKDNWTVELASESGGEYLVTLNLAPDTAPELHVIPVDELQATQWTELPPWLPDIGVVATAPAS